MPIAITRAARKVFAREVRQASASSLPVRSITSKPITMRSAASPVRGMSSAAEPKSTSTSAISRPEKTPDIRVCAPPETLIAVRESEPQAGSAWKKEPAMFPRPWPRKSRDMFERDPSAFG